MSVLTHDTAYNVAAGEKGQQLLVAVMMGNHSGSAGAVGQGSLFLFRSNLCLFFKCDYMLLK